MTPTPSPALTPQERAEALWMDNELDHTPGRVLLIAAFVSERDAALEAAAVALEKRANMISHSGRVLTHDDWASLHTLNDCAALVRGMKGKP